MRIHGTIGHLKKFVEEFNRPAPATNPPAHAGSDRNPVDTAIDASARDAFYQREQALRIRRLQHGMRRFYVAIALILFVFLLWLVRLLSHP